MPEKTKNKKRKRSERNETAENRAGNIQYKRDLKRARRRRKNQTPDQVFRLKREKSKRKGKMRDLYDAVTSGQEIPYPFDGVIPKNRSGKWRSKFLEIFHLIEDNKLKWIDEKDIFFAVCKVVDQYGHWIRSPRDFKIKFHNTNRQFSSFLRHLFCEYDVPVFMDSVWFKNDADHDFTYPGQYSWFIDVGQGKNIRKCSDLPIVLTKKMAHTFMGTPNKFNVFEAFRRAQILSLGGDKRTVLGVLGTRIGARFMEEDFWITVVRFFINNPMLDVNQYDPIVDYIRSRKFIPQPEIIEGEILYNVPQPGFSMHGRDPQSLIDKMDSWHKRLAKTSKYRSSEKWEHATINDFSITEGTKQNQRIWTIRQLLSEVELFAEGTEMRHCVGSYSGSCRLLKTSVWSLRLSNKNGINQNVLTIAVDSYSKMISQMRGFGNRTPTPKEKEIIMVWARKEDLFFGRHI